MEKAIKQEIKKLKKQSVKLYLKVAEPKAEIDKIYTEITHNPDSLNEMETFRLQAAMDRVSKMMTSLSNILKKISSATKHIVQNIK